MNQSYLRDALDIMRSFDSAEHDADILTLIYRALSDASDSGYHRGMRDQQRINARDTAFIVSSDGDVIQVLVADADVRQPRVNAQIEGFVR